MRIDAPQDVTELGNKRKKKQNQRTASSPCPTVNNISKTLPVQNAIMQRNSFISYVVPSRVVFFRRVLESRMRTLPRSPPHSCRFGELRDLLVDDLREPQRAVCR